MMLNVTAVTSDHLGASPLRELLAPQRYSDLVAAFRRKVIADATLDPHLASDAPADLYVEPSTGRLLVRCGFTGSTFFLDWSGQESELDDLVEYAAGQSTYLLLSERARDGSTGWESVTARAALAPVTSVSHGSRWPTCLAWSGPVTNSELRLLILGTIWTHEPASRPDRSRGSARRSPCPVGEWARSPWRP
jgi:hypothetical protein